MLAKMIEKIAAMKNTKIHDIDGEYYADGELRRIPPHVDAPASVDVASLDGLCKLIQMEKHRFDVPLVVEVDAFDRVKVYTSYREDFRRDCLYSARADVPGFKGGWRTHEEAVIQLQSLFVPNEEVRKLLFVLGRMSIENGVTTRDNGVSQTVEVRSGVSLRENVEIEPRVTLTPFRTFLEVAQPDSTFLLRVDEKQGIGLFEADGGVWKMEARRNVAAYLEKRLEDMVAAGDVVVLM